MNAAAIIRQLGPGWSRQPLFSIRVLFFIVSLVLSFSWRTNGFLAGNRRHKITHHHSSLLASIPRETASSITNVTITTPKFYPYDDFAGGSYPSVLHQIHVETLLSPEEAAECLRRAQGYAASTGRWDEPDKERHQTYATCDFAVEDCESLQSYLQEEIQFDNRIFKRFQALFGVKLDEMTYLDFFCANYRARTDQDEIQDLKVMDRLEAHRDGSLLSFTVLLTPPSQFEGGGTFFDALRDETPANEAVEQVLYPQGVIRPRQAGDAVFHSGKLLHGADVVTSGERTVLVGFIDVAEWCQRPDTLGEACREFGRMDVAAFRYKRQQERTGGGTKNGWFLNNSRWLPLTEGETGRSHIRGFTPAFSSAASRADPEYQRRKKLEAEDVLLRRILLPEKEQQNLFSEDEISIL